MDTTEPNKPLIEMPARDHEGYLLDPKEWSEELMLVLADEQELELSAAHREVILFVRHHYEQNATVPEVRRVLQHMKRTWDKERATRKYLYQLFPYGFAQQACKIAGMRVPLKLMLDV